jgi:hypothetical protein
MLQVLWEQGFVDGSQLEKHYTIEGWKDQFGNIDPETSVKMMMQRQMDFIEEETLLQYHGRQLGVVIDRPPNVIQKWPEKELSTTGGAPRAITADYLSWRNKQKPNSVSQ